MQKQFVEKEREEINTSATFLNKKKADVNTIPFTGGLSSVSKPVESVYQIKKIRVRTFTAVSCLLFASKTDIQNTPIKPIKKSSGTTISANNIGLLRFKSAYDIKINNCKTNLLTKMPMTELITRIPMTRYCSRPSWSNKLCLIKTQLYL
ncbi:hypothetical protein ACV07N_05555 [Roseivirga echinicomitans]